MIRLILVRHGNTFESNETPVQVGARTDLSLTARGREQAAEIGACFAREKIAGVYCGALKRQKETAQILDLGEAHFSSALTEIDYGVWEGLAADQIQARWSDEYAAWTAEGKWPNGIFGGSLEQHLKEIESWIAMLRKKYRSGDAVVAITSNGIIRLFHPERHLGGDLKVKTGNFSELIVSPDAVVVKSWNQGPLAKWICS